MQELIRSLQNPRIKHLVRLHESAHRRRQQRFLIEGLREIQRALACDWPVESLCFCEDLFTDPAAITVLELAESNGIELIPVASAPFQKASLRQNPDGLLAVAQRRLPSLEALQLSDCPLILVSEGIEKPGNLGNMFRTANAAGCDALLIANPAADPFNPNTIRASQGAFFQQPFAIADSHACIDFLCAHGITVWVTSPAAYACLWDADLRSPCACVLGAEDDGLSPTWLDDPRLRPIALPMQGVSDSLNVASMAAIVAFEAQRQRRSTPTR